jgi:hypothetical protein
VLHAYDASTLDALYNSNRASNGRDQFGAGNMFITPMIVNGKLFVGTTTTLRLIPLVDSLTTDSRMSTIGARLRVEYLLWRSKRSNGSEFSRER